MLNIKKGQISVSNKKEKAKDKWRNFMNLLFFVRLPFLSEKLHCGYLK